MSHDDMFKSPAEKAVENAAHALHTAHKVVHVTEKALTGLAVVVPAAGGVAAAVGAAVTWPIWTAAACVVGAGYGAVKISQYLYDKQLQAKYSDKNSEQTAEIIPLK